jgi:hypothetical protein
MKESKDKRDLIIDDKIFTKDDVISLIKLAIKASDEIQKKANDPSQPNILSGSNLKYSDTSHTCIELTTSDNKKTSFGFDELDGANEFLNNNIIDEVELFFNENILYSKFVLKLRTHGSSYFRVEGTDRDWINQTIKSAKEFLATCRPQVLFVKNYRIQIIAGIILFFTIFLLNFIQLFIKTQVSFPKIVSSMFHEDLGYYIFFMILISAAPAVFIYRWLRNLFPGIEFQTGVNYRSALLKRRLRLLLIASIIIVPAILTILLRML